MDAKAPLPSPVRVAGKRRLVGSLKWKVSLAKETYKRDDILQKRPIFWRSPSPEATAPHPSAPHPLLAAHKSWWCVFRKGTKQLKKGTKSQSNKSLASVCSSFVTFFRLEHVECFPALRLFSLFQMSETLIWLKWTPGECRDPDPLSSWGARCHKDSLASCQLVL